MNLARLSNLRLVPVGIALAAAISLCITTIKRLRSARTDTKLPARVLAEVLARDQEGRTDLDLTLVRLQRDPDGARQLAARGLHHGH